MVYVSSWIWEYRKGEGMLFLYSRWLKLSRVICGLAESSGDVILRELVSRSSEYTVGGPDFNQVA